MLVKLFPVLLLLGTLIVSINGDSITDPCINQTSLCFGMPDGCSTNPEYSCDILVKFTITPEAKDGIEVQLYGNLVNDRWFALGLSEDKTMGNDFVVHCNIDSTGTVTIGETMTIARHLESVDPGTMLQGSVANVNNNLVNCDWTQKATGQANGQSYDIWATEYYLILAQGPLKNGDMQHHSAKTVSSKPVHLRSTSDEPIPTLLPSPVAKLVKLHGSLMTIAWVCFVSTAIMLARHYKDSWADSTLCGVKIWFAIHRGLNITAILFVAIGMISIFKHVGGWQSSGPHPWFGVFANILMILQPIGALLRPAPNDPKRWYFNTGHFIGGNVGHLLALLAVYFASRLDSISLSSAFVRFLVIFVLFHAIVHAVMHFHIFLLTKLDFIGDVQMNGLSSKDISQEQSYAKQKIERFKQIVLIIYIVGVHLAGFALVLTVLTADPK